MNKLCRVAASLIGATGSRWKLRHVETDRNAADKPSRIFSKTNRKGVFSEFVAEKQKGDSKNNTVHRVEVKPSYGNAPEGDGTCQSDRCCPDPEGAASQVGNDLGKNV